MILVVVGCSPQPDNASEPGAVKVLLPLNNSQGKYSLDFFELKAIQDIKTLTGKFVRFFFSPNIINNKLNGSSPRARFIRTGDGNYIPSDTMSQQLAAVYAHMQRLAALDEELGVAEINRWPRDVGVAVNVNGGKTNNAFYDGKTDSMLFVPYTFNELNIALNGGIIAHEHFHSLFYKMVTQDEGAQIHDRARFLKMIHVGDESDHKAITPIVEQKVLTKSEVIKFYHFVFFRGLNEGLADFWGWMYTGDPDFIAQSLPKEKKQRSLKVKHNSLAQLIFSKNQITRDLYNCYSNSEDHAKALKVTPAEAFNLCITGRAYVLGTQIARMVKAYTDVYSTTRNIDPIKARKDVAKLIIKVLPEIEKEQKLNDKFYDSSLFLNALIDKVADLSNEECQFFAEVFNSSFESEEESPVEEGDKVYEKKYSYTCKQTDSIWKIVKEPKVEQSADQTEDQAKDLSSEPRPKPAPEVK